MKTMIRNASVVLLLFLVLAACGHTPDPPSASEVLQDAKSLTQHAFLGQIEGKDENIPLHPLVIEDMEMTWDEQNQEAEMTAYWGDDNWKSVEKHTIKIRYSFALSGQWEVHGVNVGDPVLRVIPRE